MKISQLKKGTKQNILKKKNENKSIFDKIMSI